MQELFRLLRIKPHRVSFITRLLFRRLIESPRGSLRGSNAEVQCRICFVCSNTHTHIHTLTPPTPTRPSTYIVIKRLLFRRLTESPRGPLIPTQKFSAGFRLFQCLVTNQTSTGFRLFQCLHGKKSNHTIMMRLWFRRRLAIEWAATLPALWTFRVRLVT